MKPFKVFGIGLNRTGTSTLKLALRRLGYHHCRRQQRLVNHYFQGDVAAILAETTAHDSFEDWPWPLMYEQVFAHYGERARFILTARTTPEIWLNSLKSHALSTPNKRLRQKIYGHAYPHGAEEAHMEYYEHHNAGVLDFFTRNNAAHLVHQMCWEDGDSWPELCDFLNEPLPKMPFPHVNKGEEAQIDQAIRKSNEESIAAQIQHLREAS